MSMPNEIAQRGIKEVVHFTTNHGCLGTLYTKLLQSRHRLQDDRMVEYLFSPNAQLRKDVAYLDHVSLSVEHINHQFYGVSSGSWHRDEPIFWCILAFDPVIMTHDGVEFSTTNNIYTGVRRAFGVDGLVQMFAQRIQRWAGNNVQRHAGVRNAYPTCFQAEVLYPGAVSTEHLKCIYVQTDADQCEVVGFLKAIFHRDVEVIIDPSKFEPRPV